MSIHVDIAIVGSGLVGSALACALAQGDHKLNIAVIEAAPAGNVHPKNQFDPRVVALGPSAIDFLEALSVWPTIVNLACPYLRMDVWDGEGNGSIQFDCSDMHTDALGHIVENSIVLSALRSAMTECANIHFLTDFSVEKFLSEENRSVLTLSSGQQITADFVVAADGAQSLLRKLAEIKTKEWDYGHHAIVTTVKTEHAHLFTARQRFSHQGPLAFLPLAGNGGELGKDGHYCSIVWSLLESVAEDMMSLSDEQFCRALGRTFEHKLGLIEWADKRFCIPLRQRHALSYGQPGFALVGDASHTIHPLAGQGVNLGLADVRRLAEELLRARARSIPLRHPCVVKRYQRNRKPINLLSMSAMEGFKRLFGSESLVLHSLRNRGLDRVDQTHWLKHCIVRSAAS